jgi:hypothetical protein
MSEPATKSSKPDTQNLTPELLVGLAAAAGLAIAPERAEALVAQAVPHFDLLTAIDEVDVRGTEPAGEFRLDGRAGPR